MTPEIKYFSEKWAKNPKSSVFVSLAEAYRKEGKLDDAIGVCQEGLKHQPNLSRGYVVLGKCQMEKMQYAEAKEAFENVIVHDPVNIIALKALGELYDNEKNYQKALEFYQKACDFDPFDETIQKKVDEMKMAINQESSLDEVKPSKKADGAKPTAEDGSEIATPTIANLYAKQGHYDKAIKVYEKLLAKNPNDTKIQAELALLRDKMKNKSSDMDDSLSFDLGDGADQIKVVPNKEIPLEFGDDLSGENADLEDEALQSFDLPGLDVGDSVAKKHEHSESETLDLEQNIEVSDELDAVDIDLDLPEIEQTAEFQPEAVDEHEEDTVGVETFDEFSPPEDDSFSGLSFVETDFSEQDKEPEEASEDAEHVGFLSDEELVYGTDTPGKEISDPDLGLSFRDDDGTADQTTIDETPDEALSIEIPEISTDLAVDESEDLPIEDTSEPAEAMEAFDEVGDIEEIDLDAGEGSGFDMDLDADDEVYDLDLDQPQPADTTEADIVDLDVSEAESDVTEDLSDLSDFGTDIDLPDLDSDVETPHAPADLPDELPDLEAEPIETDTDNEADEDDILTLDDVEDFLLDDQPLDDSEVVDLADDTAVPAVDDDQADEEIPEIDLGNELALDTEAINEEVEYDLPLDGLRDIDLSAIDGSDASELAGLETDSEIDLSVEIGDDTMSHEIGDEMETNMSEAGAEDIVLTDADDEAEDENSLGRVDGIPEVDLSNFEIGETENDEEISEAEQMFGDADQIQLGGAEELIELSDESPEIADSTPTPTEDEPDEFELEDADDLEVDTLEVTHREAPPTFDETALDMDESWDISDTEETATDEAPEVVEDSFGLPEIDDASTMDEAVLDLPEDVEPESAESEPDQFDLGIPEAYDEDVEEVTLDDVEDMVFGDSDEGFGTSIDDEEGSGEPIAEVTLDDAEDDAAMDASLEEFDISALETEEEEAPIEEFDLTADEAGDVEEFDISALEAEEEEAPIEEFDLTADEAGDVEEFDVDAPVEEFDISALEAEGEEAPIAEFDLTADEAGDVEEFDVDAPVEEFDISSLEAEEAEAPIAEFDITADEAEDVEEFDVDAPVEEFDLSALETEEEEAPIAEFDLTADEAGDVEEFDVDAPVEEFDLSALESDEEDISVEAFDIEAEGVEEDVTEFSITPEDDVAEVPFAEDETVEEFDISSLESDDADIDEASAELDINDVTFDAEEESETDINAFIMGPDDDVETFDMSADEEVEEVTPDESNDLTEFDISATDEDVEEVTIEDLTAEEAHEAPESEESDSFFDAFEEAEAPPAKSAAPQRPSEKKKESDIFDVSDVTALIDEISTGDEPKKEPEPKKSVDIFDISDVTSMIDDLQDHKPGQEAESSSPTAPEESPEADGTVDLMDLLAEDIKPQKKKEKAPEPPPKPPEAPLASRSEKEDLSYEEVEDFIMSDDEKTNLSDTLNGDDDSEQLPMVSESWGIQDEDVSKAVVEEVKASIEQKKAQQAPPRPEPPAAEPAPTEESGDFVDLSDLLSEPEKPETKSDQPVDDGEDFVSLTDLLDEPVQETPKEKGRKSDDSSARKPE